MRAAATRGFFTMMYKFVVYIKNDRGRYLDVISISLSAISAICFLYEQLKEGPRSLYYLAAFLLIAGALIRNWYMAVKAGKPVYYSFILLVAGATWFLMPVLQWTGVLYIMLALLEKKARLNLEIRFANEHIAFNTIMEKRYNWSQFNNILLKDGMLTLDFKNNRLIQKVVMEETKAHEPDFNEYCRQRLELDGKF